MKKCFFKKTKSFEEALYIKNNIKNLKLFILEKMSDCNYVINDETFYKELFEFLKEE